MMLLTVARVSVCTNLADAVVPGEVEAVSVSGLRGTSCGLHLLLLLIQQHLQDSNITNIWVRSQSHYSVRLSFGPKSAQTSVKLKTKGSKFSLVPIQGCLQISYLQVFDHNRVINAPSLQVDFDRLQAVGGNSDIHRSQHISHSSPEVHLKENTGTQIPYNNKKEMNITQKRVSLVCASFFTFHFYLRIYLNDC